MLKTYELIDRHFGWEQPPASRRREREIARLSARPRAALAGHRQPRLRLLPRRQAQARRCAADRDARAAQASWCRSRSRARASTEHWARPEVLDAVPDADAEDGLSTSSRRSIR